MQGVSSGLFAAPSAVKANTRQHAALEICEKFFFIKEYVSMVWLGTSAYETNLSMYELINAHRSQQHRSFPAVPSKCLF